jgi:hypothetical protein
MRSPIAAPIALLRTLTRFALTPRSSLIWRRPLTSVSISVTFDESRSFDGRLRPRVLPEAERVRCLRANDTVRSRAALGIMLAGTTAGAGGAFPGLGQAGAGNARLAAHDLSEYRDHALSPRPRKPGLELSERGESPLVRAAVERRQASALRSARAASGDADGRITRLSAFRFPFFS